MARRASPTNGTVLRRATSSSCEAVNAGEVDAGIIYHYYWYRDQEESGENSDNSQLHFFGDQDPGAFVSVSGAGVLAVERQAGRTPRSSSNFLASDEGQQAIADTYALEYPLNPEVSLDPPVKPFDELEPPRIDVGDPQRRAGDRADAGGRAALTHDAASSQRDRSPARRPAELRRPGGRLPLLLLAGVAVALLALVPLGFVVVYTVAHRPGRGLGPARPAAHRRAALEHRPAGRRLHRRLPRARGRLRLAGRAHRPALRGGCGTGCWWRRWRCPPSSTASAGSSLDARRSQGYAGALLVVTLSYYPLVYLPVVAALRGLDPALEEAAYSLGHGRWRTFVRVVLPQLRPALLGGCLLVGAAPARRVRRAADAALPDLHHRDLRPVPLHVQRRRRPT